jgi:hypothetical protein
MSPIADKSALAAAKVLRNLRRVTVKTWFMLVGASAGTAAVVAGAQLGLGQGLELFSWSTASNPAGGAWPRMLTWLAFIVASAVAAGAAIVRRRVRAVRRPAALFATRLGIVVAGAIGAAAALPLVWLQIQAAGAQVRTTVLVTIAAALVVGAVLAFAALYAAAVARAFLATAAWVWVVALVPAAVALASGRTLSVPLVATMDTSFFSAPVARWLGPYLMVVVAAVVALAVALAGRWRQAHGFGIAVSGLAGPALIAAAFLITGPDADGDPQRPTAYVATLMAATAGLLVSTAMASAQPRVAKPRPAVAAVPAAPALVAGRAPLLAIEAAPVTRWQPEPEPAVVSAWLPEAPAARAKAAKAARPARPARRLTTPKPVEVVAVDEAAQPVVAEVLPAAPVVDTPKPATTVPTPAAAPAPAERKAPRRDNKSRKRPERAKRPERGKNSTELRKHEREHVDWVHHLLSVPHSPELTTRKKD